MTRTQLQPLRIAVTGGTSGLGAALVAELVGLREALSRASLAITGEGRFDATSLAGKVVGNVLEHGRAFATPVAVVAGDADRELLPDYVRCVTLVELAASLDEAMRDARRLVAEAAERLSRAVGAPNRL